MKSAASTERAKRCEWYFDEIDGCWQTACKQAFVLNDGTPAENSMKYCCYCGGSLFVNKGKPE